MKPMFKTLISLVVCFLLVQPAYANIVRYAILFDYDESVSGFACENRHWKLEVCKNNNADCQFVRVGEKVHIPMTANRKYTIWNEKNQMLWFKRPDILSRIEDSKTS